MCIKAPAEIANSRLAKVIPDSELLHLVEFAFDENPADAEDTLLRHQALSDCIGALPAKAKEILRQAYEDGASAPEIACVSEGLDQAVDALVARIESLLNLAGMARSLTDLQVDPKAIPTMAKEAHSQWTRHFNPREVTIADLERLYEQSLHPRGNGDAK